MFKSAGRIFLIVSLFNLNACFAQHYPDREENISALEAISIPIPQTNPDELRRLQQITYPEYKIQPGDVFEIHLYGEDALHMPEAKVSLNGTLTYYLTGETQVVGLSIAEAQNHLKIKLLNYFESPDLSLIPKEINSLKYTVLGKVAKPGLYPINRPLKVLDVLSVAEGLTSERLPNSFLTDIDLKSSYILRNNTVLPVRFDQLLIQGDSRHNIPIMPNDHIYIAPASHAEIYVLGEVKTPNIYPYSRDLTLTQVLTLAGGLNNLAELNQVNLIRGGLHDPQVYHIDLQAILKGQKQDVLLKAGDMIYVSPNGLALWKQITDSVLPSLQSLQSAFFIYDISRRNLQ